MDIARDLSSIAGADERFRDGRISFHNAAVLARTAAEIGPEAAAIASPALVDAALRVDPDRMRLIGRQLRHAVDPGGALAQALRDHERRRLTVNQSFDGVFLVACVQANRAAADAARARQALPGMLVARLRPPAGVDGGTSHPTLEQGWSYQGRQLSDSLQGASPLCA
jgi:hypothetical protein